MHSPDETIVAIAAPPGGAARGIVRLSGPKLRSCLEDCFRPDLPAGDPASALVALTSLTRPTVVSGTLWLSGFASPAPCELYLWPGKRSYTGQPVAEVHTMGSPPLLEAIVKAACRGGARPAEPGEFTLRAFLAGRIDLTQAEAVLGVIDAAGGAELDAALKQLAGGLAAPLWQLRDDLLDLLAHLEAGFDFADEDLPFITAGELLAELQSASEKVEHLSQKLAFRGESAARVRVVLVGPPNAGKSSLFNALTGRGPHAGVPAIVSDVPGTTRDYLSAELDLDGVRCELVDTAGIWPGDCPDFHGHEAANCRSARRENGTLPISATADIEQAAQRLTQQMARSAHVRVVCREHEATGGEQRGDCPAFRGHEKANRRSARRENGTGYPPGAFAAAVVNERGEGSEQIDVLTKCDLCATEPNLLATSAMTGVGIRDLKNAIRAAVLRISAPQKEVVAGTAIRCSESLRLAAASLDRARAAVAAHLGEELVANEVRVALNELGKVAGAVYTEDVLDRIFSRFCIGK